MRASWTVLVKLTVSGSARVFLLFKEILWMTRLMGEHVRENMEVVAMEGGAQGHPHSAP